MYLDLTLPRAALRIPYRGSAKAVGGKAPITYSATGLPSGVTINQNTGVISGTHTAAFGDQWNITVTATDADGVKIQNSARVTVLHPEYGDAGFNPDPINDKAQGATVTGLRPDSPLTHTTYDGKEWLSDKTS